MKHLLKLLIISVLLLSILYSLMTPAFAVIVDDNEAEEVYTETGAGVPSEQDFTVKLNQLRNKYPHGVAWEGVYYEYGTAKAWTCHAYAVQLFCEVFGVQFYTGGYYTNRDYNYGTICAGDIVRIDYDSHSIFITKVTDDYIYFTDGNSIGYNVVRWDGKYSISEFKSRYCYKYHFSGNTLTGSAPMTHTIAYKANGGEGSAASFSQPVGGKLTLQSGAFTRSGYTFAGYSVKRKSDSTWYTKEYGWQPISAIIDNGYVIHTFAAGKAYSFGPGWVSGLTDSTTFYCYAQWIPDETILTYYANESGANYLCSPFTGDVLSQYIRCDGGVYTLGVDTEDTLNESHTLSVTASAAGGDGKEFSIETTTNYGHSNGYTYAGPLGDSRVLTFSFIAKSSVDGAKMMLRFSGSTIDTAQSVTLTNTWARYTVKVPKNDNVGHRLSIYFDQKGKYSLSSMILAEGDEADSFIAESGGIIEVSRMTRGMTPENMPVPTREGYTFLGWFTRNVGGAHITAQTTVNVMRLNLYAHWRKNISDTPVKTVVNGRHTYELYEDSLSRDAAADFCEQKGGTLVTVTNETEQHIVNEMLEGYSQFCWLGLDYDNAAKEWRWDSGESVRRTLWASGEGGAENGQYHAVIVPIMRDGVYAAGMWYDCASSDNEALYLNEKNSIFICEYVEAPPLTEVVGHGICGDVDNDGDVTIIDATRIQQSLAGLITLDEDALAAADTDLSEDITIIDVTLIQRHLVGIFDKFSCIGQIIEFTRVVTDQSTPDEPIPVHDEDPTDAPVVPSQASDDPPPGSVD